MFDASCCLLAIHSGTPSDIGSGAINLETALAAYISKPLLADAEPAEDNAKEIVGGEFAGDRRERGLPFPQFLGE